MVLEGCLCSGVSVLIPEAGRTASGRFYSKRECKLPVMMTDRCLAFSELIGLSAALPPSKILHPQLPVSDGPTDWCEKGHVEM